jgi:menaquinone-dependent protoporphyrinogen oxidase
MACPESAEEVSVMMDGAGAGDGPGQELKVLVTAASQGGSTAEIARAIAGTLTRCGLRVTVLAPAEVISVAGYDAVILGSAVYTGHWLDPAKDLVNRCRDGLASRPVWLFSSGPVGDPSRKLTQAMDQDPADLLAILTATRARGHRRFAGKLDPTTLRPLQRASLLVFRGLKGDFRDWPAIEQWARDIAHDLMPVPDREPSS